MAATQHLRAAAEVRPACCSTASRNMLIARRLDRPRLHRRAHERLRRRSRRTSQPFTLERVAEATGLPAAAIERLADDDPRGQAGLVLVDDGRQPEPRGRAHGAGDHQPGADDRQHRPARHRRQLDHRPVQRDGLAAVQQHHQPAGRPRLHQRRAPREGRRHAGHRRGAHPARATAWAYDQIIEGDPARARSGACGSSPPTRRIRGSTRPTRATCSARLDFLVVQDMYTTTETAQHGRTWCCRRRAGARRRGRSSTPSAGSA